MTSARRVAWWLLIATLALLPFETVLPRFPLGPLTLTTLEAAWMAAIAVWLASLVLSRRRPHVPAVLLVVLVVLLAVNLASALLADSLNGAAVVFVGRSMAGWLLLVAVADLVDDRAALRNVLRAIVAGAAVSALIGLALYIVPGLADELHVRIFQAAGAPRLSGSFDYPNTAAMFWEAACFLAAALIVLEPKRANKWLSAIALVVMIAAALLTLSRGAALGAGAALLVIAALALWSRRRRLAGAVAVAAAGVVAAALLVQVTVAPVARLFTDGERGLYGATYQAPVAVSVSGTQATIPVTVTNTGQVTWNDMGPDDYTLGYHWLVPGTTQIVAEADPRIALGTVYPGATTTVTVAVDVPDPTAKEEVAWDIMRPNGAWFSDTGVPVYTTEVGAGALSGGGNPVTLSSDPENTQRAELWDIALQMIGERPILGVGPGTYHLRYGPYMGLSTWDERVYANNMYLDVASTTGIAGLIAFLALVAVCVSGLVRSLSRPSPDWLVLACVLGTVVAFIAHGFVDYFLAFNPTGGLWWVALGLALAAPRVLSPGVHTGETS